MAPNHVGSVSFSLSLSLSLSINKLRPAGKHISIMNIVRRWNQKKQKQNDDKIKNNNKNSDSNKRKTTSIAFQRARKQCIRYSRPIGHRAEHTDRYGRFGMHKRAHAGARPTDPFKPNGDCSIAIVRTRLRYESALIGSRMTRAMTTSQGIRSIENKIDICVWFHRTIGWSAMAMNISAVLFLSEEGARELYLTHSLRLNSIDRVTNVFFDLKKKKQKKVWLSIKSSKKNMWKACVLVTWFIRMTKNLIQF